MDTDTFDSVEETCIGGGSGVAYDKAPRMEKEIITGVGTEK